MPAASVRRDGHDLRDRQPEGRRGQDDDRGQRRRLHRRGRLPDAAGRHRPAGQRDRRPRPPEGHAPEHLRRPDGRRAAPTRRSSSPTIAGLHARCRPTPTSRARTSSCRAGRAPRRACATRSARVRERFAFMLLDCPPSLGPLTVNALVAADRVIVPVQTEYFALEGLAGLLDTLALIQRELNPRLTVAGMLLTMHDGRTRLARDVEREVREHFPELVFDTVIPRNVRIGEAPSFGRPVIHHDPHCAGRRCLLRTRQGGGRPWLSRRGMGRGLAAILTVSEPPRTAPSRRRAARAAGRADRAEPAPAAQAVRRRGAARRSPTRCASAACCSRSSCARVAGGTLRAGRRRAPLARRAARRARDGPGARARPRRRRSRSRSR